MPRAYRPPLAFGQRPDPFFDTDGGNSVTRSSDRVTERLGADYRLPQVLGQGHQCLAVFALPGHHPVASHRAEQVAICRSLTVGVRVHD